MLSPGCSFVFLFVFCFRGLEKPAAQGQWDQDASGDNRGRRQQGEKKVQPETASAGEGRPGSGRHSGAADHRAGKGILGRGQVRVGKQNEVIQIVRLSIYNNVTMDI